MSNAHNIPPFFRRRIDHHKFEKMMREGIMYMYYDSKSLEEFKWKLVQVTLENYLHYKYEIDLDTVPEDEVTDFIKYMIDVYDPLLKSYYYSARRKGKGPVNEGTMDNTIQRMINSSVKELLDVCNDFDDETFPDYLSLEDCGFIDLIHKITVKKITPIKKLSNLPMFDVEIDIDYNSAISSVDFDEELSMITDHIKKKYKIFLVFTVMEQNNLHDRQMEGSLKPLIKNVLREEMTDIQMYMWKLKHEIEENYYKVTRKFEDPWLKNTEIESIYWDNFAKIFEVVIRSNTNIELTWWIQFDQNMKMESVIRHETKDWEYNIKDVEEIGGFENDFKDFWSVIKYIYPYAQKYIIRRKKEKINESEENKLKSFFFKLWDTKMGQGQTPTFDLKTLQKLGLLKREDEIRNYYIEYMGGQEELERNIKNYFVGQTFTTQDIMDQRINVGNYDFVFKMVDMSFEQTNMLGNGELELYASFDIVEGNVTVFSGEEYDLMNHDSIDDNLWWELDLEIKDLIQDFMYEIISSFGIYVNQIYLEWG
jgi:hypothetical protein